MDLPGAPPAGPGDKVRQVCAALRPGACTIVDWALRVAADDGGDADGTEAEQASAQGSDSEGSGDEGGYASNAPSLPPAIANDPFFARLLRNAEMHEASEHKKRKSKAKRRASVRKRRVKDAADDVYDLDDPFIDDSELTVMDSHNYAKAQQSKKRRRKDDGNSTETEGPGVAAAAGADDAAASVDAASGELGIASLDDLDKYEEDDFFVYHGPLNEQEEVGSDADAFDAPAKGARARGRQERKQPAKAPAQGRKKASGTGAAKGDISDTGARKKPEPKTQNRRTTSDIVSAGQVPSNGRKSGARTSRKLGPAKQASAPDATAADSAKPHLPPIPGRDRPTPPPVPSGGALAPTTAANATESASAAGAGSTAAAAPATPGKGGGAGGKPHNRRAGTPGSGAPLSAAAAAPDDDRATVQARQATPEIEAALLELRQAADREDFANRQRFPSSLKPFLRQVCELSMVHALEHDCEVLALDSPENRVFSWSTPLDMVGFTTDIYHRLADILPYNRATLRKIVSKLLGPDLLTWKERQLKQIEEGLKARVDGQIESNMGWIPVAVRANSKEGEDSSSGGSQVRWHWTTLSKHLLYQYMVLTLNINELRNQLGLATGKDGACREQQARKDAYAHLISLWPGSSMSTYEISRAYSSRKSLLEKQNKKTDSGPAAPPIDAEAPATGPAEPVVEAASSPAPRRTPEPPAVAVATAAAAAEPRLTPATSVGSPGQPLAQLLSDKLSPAATHPASPYAHIEHMSSPHRSDYIHRSPLYAGFGQSPGQHFEPPPAHQAASYHGGAGAHFGAPAASRRSLEFEPAGQLPSHFYHSDDLPVQVPQQHHQPPQQHHQPPYQGNQSPYQSHQPQPQHQNQHSDSNDTPGDASYSSPNSGRYSMSVRNLTTP